MGAQLATLTATVAALNSELYRSLNGLEKVTEKGFESVGTRLDRLEERMRGQETAHAAMNARVEALEGWRAEEGRRDDVERQAINNERGVLRRESQKLATWQILVAALVGLLGVLGTIGGIVSAFT